MRQKEQEEGRKQQPMVQALYFHLPSCISVNETSVFPLALGSPIHASPIQHSYSRYYLLSHPLPTGGALCGMKLVYLEIV